MKIRVLGGGLYGCHLTLALAKAGHQVELHEISSRLFNGASGANPARLHLGFHYPRSRLTRAACQDHQGAFLAAYGQLTRPVPINIYAVAARDSLVDFGTYKQVLRGEVEFIEVTPSEFGLENCEGALLTGERHVVVDDARAHFTRVLGEAVKFGTAPGVVDDPGWDWTVDCTFCANDSEAIDRYEPCVMGLLWGPTNRAVTIMDGPFPSLFPWREEAGLSSLTSALHTPLSKTCRTWAEAKAVLDAAGAREAIDRVRLMYDQMAQFWPEVKRLYSISEYRTAIRAMPRSAADARLVDVVRVGDRALRVRAGKIDAIFAAERIVAETIERPSQ